MANTQKQIRANAKRKLKEFHRWQRVAGLPLLTVDSSYRFEGVEGAYEPIVLRIRKDIAINEIKAIAHAINQISDERGRRIIAERYYLKPLYSNDTLARDMGVSMANFYRLKQLALSDFARAYRLGVLETYEE